MTSQVMEETRSSRGAAEKAISCKEPGQQKAKLNASSNHRQWCYEYWAATQGLHVSGFYLYMDGYNFIGASAILPIPQLRPTWAETATILLLELSAPSLANCMEMSYKLATAFH
jgi:hypothetical protein